MEYANRYSAEEFCNAMITLISQCIYLLRRLIAKQQEQFINEGGIKEKMYKVRTEHRAHPKKQSPFTDPNRPESRPFGPETDVSGMRLKGLLWV